MGEMAFPRCTLKWTQHGDDITYFFLNRRYIDSFMVGIVHCHLSFRGLWQQGSAIRFFFQVIQWWQVLATISMRGADENWGWVECWFERKTRHFQSSRNKHSGQIPSKQHYLQMNVSIRSRNMSSFPNFFPTNFVPFFLKNSFPIPQKTGTNNNRPGSDTTTKSDQTAPTTGTNGRELAA